MADVAQGGVKGVASTGIVTKGATEGVTFPPVPTDNKDNLSLVNLASAVDTQTLLRENRVTVNANGTISFAAQTQNPNSEIKYSFLTKDGKAVELQAIEGSNKYSNLKETNGLSIETTQSESSANNRNVYLTIGNDIDKFRIDLDGKTYIIDRKKIDEINKGKTETKAVATLSTDAGSPKTGTLPTNPIVSSKYPGLENLKISPNGEVQFSLTSNSNDLLIHYARHDGSCSNSGYRTNFRSSNMRQIGAYHEDRTFSIDINYLTASSVKVDFTLNNAVKTTNITMGGKVYAINIDELKKYIIEETLKAKSPGLPAGGKAGTSSGTSTPATFPTGSGPSNGSATTALSSVPRTPVSPPDAAVVAAVGKNPLVIIPDVVAATAAAATVLQNQQAKALKTSDEKTNSKLSEKEIALLAENAAKSKKIIDDAKARIAEIARKPPENLEELRSTAKELKANQREAFKALDADADGLRKKIKEIANPDAAESKAAEKELAENRRTRAELVTERIKLNQLIAESAAASSDPKLKRAAEIEIRGLKAEGTEAFKELVDLAPEGAAKDAVRVKQTEFIEAVEKIKPSFGQRIGESAIATKWQAFREWYAENSVSSVLAKVARVDARANAASAVVLAEATKLNASAPELLERTAPLADAEMLGPPKPTDAEKLTAETEATKQAVEKLKNKHKFISKEYVEAEKELDNAQKAPADTDPSKGAREKLIEATKSTLERVKLQELLGIKGIDEPIALELEKELETCVQKEIKNLDSIKDLLRAEYKVETNADIKVELYKAILESELRVNTLEASEKHRKLTRKAEREVEDAKRKVNKLSSTVDGKPKKEPIRQETLEAEIDLYRKQLAQAKAEQAGAKESLESQRQFIDKLTRELMDLNSKAFPDGVEKGIKDKFNTSIKSVESRITDVGKKLKEVENSAKSLEAKLLKAEVQLAELKATPKIPTQIIKDLLKDHNFKSEEYKEALEKLAKEQELKPEEGSIEKDVKVKSVELKNLTLQRVKLEELTGTPDGIDGAVRNALEIERGECVKNELRLITELNDFLESANQAAVKADVKASLNVRIQALEVEKNALEAAEMRRSKTWAAESKVSIARRNLEGLKVPVDATPEEVSKKLLEKKVAELDLYEKELELAKAQQTSARESLTHQKKLVDSLSNKKALNDVPLPSVVEAEMIPQWEQSIELINSRIGQLEGEIQSAAKNEIEANEKIVKAREAKAALEALNSKPKEAPPTETKPPPPETKLPPPDRKPAPTTTESVNEAIEKLRGDHKFIGEDYLKAEMELKAAETLRAEAGSFQEIANKALVELRRLTLERVMFDELIDKPRIEESVRKELVKRRGTCVRDEFSKYTQQIDQLSTEYEKTTEVETKVSLNEKLLELQLGENAFIDSELLREKTYTAKRNVEVAEQSLESLKSLEPTPENKAKELQAQLNLHKLELIEAEAKKRGAENSSARRKLLAKKLEVNRQSEIDLSCDEKITKNFNKSIKSVNERIAAVELEIASAKQNVELANNNIRAAKIALEAQNTPPTKAVTEPPLTTPETDGSGAEDSAKGMPAEASSQLPTPTEAITADQIIKTTKYNSQAVKDLDEAVKKAEQASGEAGKQEVGLKKAELKLLKSQLLMVKIEDLLADRNGHYELKDEIKSELRARKTFVNADIVNSYLELLRRYEVEADKLGERINKEKSPKEIEKLGEKYAEVTKARAKTFIEYEERMLAQDHPEVAKAKRTLVAAESTFASASTADNQLKAREARLAYENAITKQLRVKFSDVNERIKIIEKTNSDLVEEFKEHPTKLDVFKNASDNVKPELDRLNELKTQLTNSIGDAQNRGLLAQAELDFHNLRHPVKGKVVSTDEISKLEERIQELKDKVPNSEQTAETKSELVTGKAGSGEATFENPAPAPEQAPGLTDDQKAQKAPIDPTGEVQEPKEELAESEPKPDAVADTKSKGIADADILFDEAAQEAEKATEPTETQIEETNGIELAKQELQQELTKAIEDLDKLRSGEDATSTEESGRIAAAEKAISLMEASVSELEKKLKDGKAEAVEKAKEATTKEAGKFERANNLANARRQLNGPVSSDEINRISQEVDKALTEINQAGNIPTAEQLSDWASKNCNLKIAKINELLTATDFSENSALKTGLENLRAEILLELLEIEGSSRIVSIGDLPTRKVSVDAEGSDVRTSAEIEKELKAQSDALKAKAEELQQAEKKLKHQESLLESGEKKWTDSKAMISEVETEISVERERIKTLEGEKGESSTKTEEIERINESLKSLEPLLESSKDDAAKNESEVSETGKKISNLKEIEIPRLESDLLMLEKGILDLDVQMSEAKFTERPEIQSLIEEVKGSTEAQEAAKIRLAELQQKPLTDSKAKQDLANAELEIHSSEFLKLSVEQSLIEERIAHKTSLIEQLGLQAESLELPNPKLSDSHVVKILKIDKEREKLTKQLDTTRSSLKQAENNILSADARKNNITKQIEVRTLREKFQTSEAELESAPEVKDAPKALLSDLDGAIKKVKGDLKALKKQKVVDSAQQELIDVIENELKLITEVQTNLQSGQEIKNIRAELDRAIVELREMNATEETRKTESERKVRDLEGKIAQCYEKLDSLKVEARTDLSKMEVISGNLELARNNHEQAKARIEDVQKIGNPNEQQLNDLIEKQTAFEKALLEHSNANPESRIENELRIIEIQVDRAITISELDTIRATASSQAIVDAQVDLQIAENALENAQTKYAEDLTDINKRILLDAEVVSDERKLSKAEVEIKGFDEAIDKLNNQLKEITEGGKHADPTNRSAIDKQLSRITDYVKLCSSVSADEKASAKKVENIRNARLKLVDFYKGQVGDTPVFKAEEALTQEASLREEISRLIELETGTKPAPEKAAPPLNEVIVEAGETGIIEPAPAESTSETDVGAVTEEPKPGTESIAPDELKPNPLTEPTGTKLGGEVDESGIAESESALDEAPGIDTKGSTNASETLSSKSIVEDLLKGDLNSDQVNNRARLVDEARVAIDNAVDADSDLAKKWLDLRENQLQRAKLEELRKFDGLDPAIKLELERSYRLSLELEVELLNEVDNILPRDSSISAEQTNIVVDRIQARTKIVRLDSRNFGMEQIQELELELEAANKLLSDLRSSGHVESTEKVETSRLRILEIELEMANTILSAERSGIDALKQHLNAVDTNLRALEKYLGIGKGEIRATLENISRSLQAEIGLRETALVKNNAEIGIRRAQLEAEKSTSTSPGIEKSTEYLERAIADLEAAKKAGSVTKEQVNEVTEKLSQLENALKADSTVNKANQPANDRRIIEIRAERAVFEAEQLHIDSVNGEQFKAAQKATIEARQAAENSRNLPTDKVGGDRELKIAEAESLLESKEKVERHFEHRYLDESIDSLDRVKLVDDLSSSPEELAEASRQATERIDTCKARLREQKANIGKEINILEKVVPIRDALIKLYRSQINPKSALPEGHFVAEEARLLNSVSRLKQDYEKQKLERGNSKIADSEPTTPSTEAVKPPTSEPPVDSAEGKPTITETETSDPEAPKDNKFDVKEALKRYESLAKEQVRLMSKKSLTEAQSIELKEIVIQRAKLALNAKAAFEAEIAKASSEKAVTEAKNSLYRTWGEKIASALQGGERVKFEAEGAKYIVDQDLANRTFRSGESTRVNDEFNKLKKVYDPAKATDFEKANFQIKGAELEQVKAEELLGRPGISESVKSELQVRRRASINEQIKACEELRVKIEASLTGAEPKVQAEGRAKLAGLDFVLQDLGNSLHSNYAPQFDKAAEIVENNHFEALDALELAKKAYVENPTPEAEKAVKLAQVDVDKTGKAKIDYEVDLANKDLENTKKFRDEQKAKLEAKDTPKEVKKIIKDKLPEQNESIASKEKVLKHTQAKQELLAKKLQISEAELALHDLASDPANAKAAETKTAELKTLNENSIELEKKYNKLNQEAANSARVRAGNLIKATLKNPMAQLAAITTVNEAINAALYADLDPKAAHTWAPRILYAYRLEDYLNTFETTKEMGTKEAIRADVFSKTIDTGVQFGLMLGAFHLVTGNKVPIGGGYHIPTVPSAYGAAVGKGGMGEAIGALSGKLMHNVINPGIVLLATGEMAYHSVADGRFIERDGLVGNSVTLGMPTASTLIMGGTAYSSEARFAQWVASRALIQRAEDSILTVGARGLLARVGVNAASRGGWGGPIGVGVTAAVQLATTFRGVHVALENLDEQCKNSIVAKGVNRSIDLALMNGFYIDDASKAKWNEIAENTPKTGETTLKISDEEVAAISEKAKIDFYMHLMRCAEGESTTDKTPYFRGQTYILESYTDEELRTLGIAFQKGVDLDDRQWQEHNFGVVNGLFSSDRPHGAGAVPIAGGVVQFFGGGTTALNNIEDERLRKKVSDHIDRIKDWYIDVYQHSLKVQSNSTDTYSTADSFWANYLTFNNNAGYNDDGRLNGRVDIQNRMREYAKSLSENPKFKADVLSQVNADDASNMFNVLGSLEDHYPGITTILKTDSGYGLFVHSFAMMEKIKVRNMVEGKEVVTEVEQLSDRHYEMAEKFSQFRDYVKSLDGNPEYKAFVEEVRSSPNGIFQKEGGLNPKFEKFFPGIDEYILMQMTGHGESLGVMENMLGRDSTIVLAVKEALQKIQAESSKFEVEVSGDNNISKLAQVIEKSPLETGSTDFFQIEKLNIERRADGRGYVDPAGMRLKGYGWAFVRSFNATEGENKGKPVPGVLVINQNDLKLSDDIIVQKAFAILQAATNTDGTVRFNENIKVPSKKAYDLEFYGCSVQSDGSISLTHQDERRGRTFSYVVAPYKGEDGRIVWKKKEVHDKDGRILHGKD